MEWASREVISVTGRNLRVLLLLVACLLTTNATVDYAWGQPLSRGVGVVARDPGTGEQGTVHLYRRTIAVVIGIDHYLNLGPDRQLRYARRDAEAVAELLQRRFRFDEVITLMDQDATRSAIEDLFLGRLAKTSPDDSVLVFWAGHGVTRATSAGGALGYLLPYDGSEDRLSQDIPMGRLTAEFARLIPARHMFFVLDACFGGVVAQTRSAASSSRRDLTYIRQVAAEPVRQVLTAGTEDQEVLDSGPSGHSVFAGRLIEVLEGIDDFITASELMDVVARKVSGDARALGHEQTPLGRELSGNGNYVFVPQEAAATAEAEARLAGLLEEVERLEVEAGAAAKDAESRRQAMAELDARRLEVAEQERRLRDAEARRRAPPTMPSDDVDEVAARRRDQEVELASLEDAARRRRDELRARVDQGEPLIEVRRQLGGLVRELGSTSEGCDGEMASDLAAIEAPFGARLAALSKDVRVEFESRSEHAARIAERSAAIEVEAKSKLLDAKRFWRRLCEARLGPIAAAADALRRRVTTVHVQPSSVTLGTYDPEADRLPVTVRFSGGAGGRDQLLAARARVDPDVARALKQRASAGLVSAVVQVRVPSPETVVFEAARLTLGDAAEDVDLLAGALADPGDGTLVQAEAGLRWSGTPRPLGGSYVVGEEDAVVQSCAAGKEGGFTDWTVPSARQVQSLEEAVAADASNPLGIQLGEESRSWHWRGQKYRPIQTAMHPMLEYMSPIVVCVREEPRVERVTSPGFDCRSTTRAGYEIRVGSNRSGALDREGGESYSSVARRMAATWARCELETEGPVFVHVSGFFESGEPSELGPEHLGSQRRDRLWSELLRAGVPERRLVDGAVSGDTPRTGGTYRGARAIASSFAQVRAGWGESSRFWLEVRARVGDGGPAEVEARSAR